jgi:hypothetical protein
MMSEDQLIGEIEFDLSDVSYRRRETDRPQPLDYPTQETADKIIQSRELPQSATQLFFRRIFKLR